MKIRLWVIMIAVSSVFTIAYVSSISYEIERCTSDIVYVDFTNEFVLREICKSPQHVKTITDTFLGCGEGFMLVNNRCNTLDLPAHTRPFGYFYNPRDTTGDYDHCFSYKTDPEYGVRIRSSTHILNIQNCEWELKNEN